MTTTPAELTKMAMEQAERIDKTIFRNLSYAGDQAVNTAKASHSKDWTDQTGNLRSSIGYIITKDGEMVTMSKFDTVKEGAEGAEKGKAYAQSLTAEHPTGWCLTVVAGMHYASYVANKGYDVLDSAELKARDIAAKLLKDIEDQSKGEQ